MLPGPYRNDIPSTNLLSEKGDCPLEDRGTVPFFGSSTMILEVQHETRLEYSEPVTESITEVRMEPVSDADQSCRSFHLALSPATELHRFQDGFGNRVHHFDFLAAHDQVRILAAGIVETHPRFRDLQSS